MKKGKIKNCGSCQYFLKMKSMKDNSGLCNYEDHRTNTDCGHKCEFWKAKPYLRKKFRYE